AIKVNSVRSLHKTFSAIVGRYHDHVFSTFKLSSGLYGDDFNNNLYCYSFSSCRASIGNCHTIRWMISKVYDSDAINVQTWAGSQLEFLHRQVELFFCSESLSLRGTVGAYSKS